MKNKIYSVNIAGLDMLVSAKTTAGAVAAAANHLYANAKAGATAALATGEQLYHAGRDGTAVIGEDSGTMQPADPSGDLPFNPDADDVGAMGGE